MQEQSAVPALFDDKPCRPAVTMQRGETLREGKLPSKIFWAICGSFGTLGGFVIFPILGIVCFFSALYYWAAVADTLMKAKSNDYFRSDCPQCGKPVRFVGSDAFKCKTCKKKLILYQGNVYAIS